MGYAEIMPSAYYGTIKKTFDDQVKSKNFVTTTISNKEDLWPALKDMLKPELKKG